MFEVRQGIFDILDCLNTGTFKLLNVKGVGKTVTIGSQNTGFIHFMSNGGVPFYFNTDTVIAGVLRPYVNQSFDLGTSSLRWDTIYGDTLNLSGGIQITHNKAIKGLSNSGSPINIAYTYNNTVYIGAGGDPATQVILGTKNGNVQFLAVDGYTSYNAYFYPNTDGKVTLGTTSGRWYRVYAKSSSISTSDYNEKKDIAPLGTIEKTTPDIKSATKSRATTTAISRTVTSSPPTDEDDNIYLKLFDNLKPMQYRMIDGDEKLCFGFIAQDIEESMEELNITKDALDLVHHDVVTGEDGEEKETYGLAYENVIALMTLKIQELQKQIEKLKVSIGGGIA